MSPRGIFANRWWIVVASVIALIVGVGSINVFAFGVFLKPVSAELGFTRGTLGSALLLNSFATALASPLFGICIDRWGIRTVMLPSIALFALVVAGFSLLTPAPAVLYLLYFLSGATGVGQTTIGYSKVIAAWFDRQRGIALGITLAGVGLGTTLVPPFVGVLIGEFGWRSAYVGLGIAIFVLAFLPAAIFVREPGAAKVAQTALERARLAALARGVAVRDALRDGRFWAMAVAFFLAVAVINGTLTHVVALLTDRGFSIQMAIAALSTAGIALTIGRVIVGYCLDRFFGPYVAIAFFILPMIGLGLLAANMGGTISLIGTVLCGLGIGAEVDLMAFLMSRYFGLRAFGQIYGWVFAIFTIGTGFGPYVMGVGFDMFHSYQPMFAVFEVALVIVCILFARLGPYSFPPENSQA